MVDIARTPSAQHAVAMIADSVAGTVRNLEQLEAAKINISLDPGRRLFKPLMEGFDLAWAVRQCELEREKNIKPNVGLVEAFAPYAQDKGVRWFRPCDPQFYPIGAGVLMPVRPAGFWPEAGRLRLLWVQSWKGRTLDPLQKAIFNTILHRSVLVGDFKDAEVEWLDLREQRPGQGRGIEVISGQDLGLLSEAELQAYMQILLTAFHEYKAGRDRRRAEARAAQRGRPASPTPLFPDDLDAT
jgi:hypothetical protein